MQSSLVYCYIELVAVALQWLMLCTIGVPVYMLVEYEYLLITNSEYE